MPEDQLEEIDEFVSSSPDYRGRSEFFSKAAVVLMGSRAAKLCNKCRRPIGDKHAYCSNCVALMFITKDESE